MISFTISFAYASTFDSKVLVKYSAGTDECLDLFKKLTDISRARLPAWRWWIVRTGTEQPDREEGAEAISA